MNSVEVASREIDYRQWRGATADELGCGTGNRYHSFTYRHEAKNGQETNVSVVDGRRSYDDPTFIGVLPYNIRPDRMLEAQSMITARQVFARVIMAEMPGVTIDKSDPWHTGGDCITPLQLIRDGLGDFDHIALTQLEAIDAAVAFRSGEQVRFMAQSLGTMAIASMARVLREDRFTKSLAVSGIDIIESVNTYGDRQFLRPLRVLKNLENIEAPRHEFYFKENEMIGHADVTFFERESSDNLALYAYLTKKQRLAIVLPVVGLHRSIYGPLVVNLPNKKRFQDIPITFYRGNDSSVSLESDTVAVAEALHEVGADVRVINLIAGHGDETEIGHHFSTSLGRYASFSQLLRQ